MTLTSMPTPFQHNQEALAFLLRRRLLFAPFRALWLLPLARPARELPEESLAADCGSESAMLEVAMDGAALTASDEVASGLRRWLPFASLPFAMPEAPAQDKSDANQAGVLLMLKPDFACT